MTSADNARSAKAREKPKCGEAVAQGDEKSSKKPKGWRKFDDLTRFERVMKFVVGRRLTYRRLCAINDSGFMGIE